MPRLKVALASTAEIRTFWVLVMALAVLGLILRDPSSLSLVTIGLVWLSVNSSWNLVLGYAGVFSFGQIAFFSIGAYVSAILNNHLDVPPEISTLAGLVGGALAAALIGLAAIRLRGVYVALVTLAFHELLRTVISTDYSGLTGGPNGLSVDRYLPQATVLMQSRADYFVALAIFLLCGSVLLKLLNAPFGLALVASRDAEHVATARGINRQKYQLAAFEFSGAIAGLAGGFYAHYVGVVAPTIISFALVMNLFAMIIVGGLGSFNGPILGTAIVTFFTTYFQGVSPQYQSLILACVLLAMVLFLPKGVVGTFSTLNRRSVRREP